MRTNLFWQGLSCVALVAALAVVVMHVTSPRPVKADGASAGGIIAVTAAESSNHRLYLIDTNRKVILVYGGRNQWEFTMFTGRYFDMDSQATVGLEHRFRQQGYTIREMQQIVTKREAESRGRTR